MAKLTLNSIPNSVFSANASELADNSLARANFVSAGRLLAYEYAKKGANALRTASKMAGENYEPMLSQEQYRTLNEKFQAEHLLYAAKLACAQTGVKAPESFEELKRQSANFRNNEAFYRVLAGVWQEVLSPILPTTYSEAVSTFAEVYEVGFNETQEITIDSNDIPIFQDASWGAIRSTPRNRFYARSYTLNPQPKVAKIAAKWSQLINTGFDFGRYFANVTAGMYAKTMGMWNAAMTAAASDTSLIPSGLTQTFNATNWVALANKIATVNGTTIDNVVAYGGAVALSKVLPLQTTGSTNVNMDAALATLLGADYIRSGQLGEYMNVRLQQLTDAVVPGTQNSTIDTILPTDTIWMMASNGHRPLAIAYNRDTPLTLEVDPMKAGDMEVQMVVTIALDTVAIFGSKVGLITI